MTNIPNDNLRGQQARVLAEVAPSQAKVGWVFFKGAPLADELERTVLREWHNPLYHPKWMPWSNWAFDRDDGKPVLAHLHGDDGILLSRESDWTDYNVSLGLRTFSRQCEPWPGNGLITTARYGIILRFQDLHRYYFYCLEGTNRVALYRREDMLHFDELAAQPFPFDPENYHEMRAVVAGSHLSCFLDGQEIFVAEDGNFSKGAAGVRVCGIVAIRNLRVATDERGWANISTERLRSAAEREGLRRQVPRMELARTIRLSSSPETDHQKVGSIWFADLRGGGRKDLLCLCPHAAGGKALVAADVSGEPFWEAHGKNWGDVRWADFNGDGQSEVLAVADGAIRILNGKTGAVQQEVRLPSDGPLTEPPHLTLPGGHVYPCWLHKAPTPPGVLFIEGATCGARSIWVYDHQLRLRFSLCFEQPPFGHHAFCHDVDGDGREEILIGHRLVDGEGNILWTMEGAKCLDLFGPGRHADNVSVGWMTDDPAGGYFAAFSTGDDGLILADARNGRVIARHFFGHVQGHSIAKYRKDIPGMQVICGTRHRGYGILALVDARGRVLHRWQPDFRSQGGRPVNWKGDGEEYLALSTTPEAMGLWDAWGRKVIEPPAEVRAGAMLMPHPLLAGDPRDCLAFVVGNEIRIYGPTGGEVPPPRKGGAYTPRRDWNRHSTYVSFPAWRARQA